MNNELYRKCIVPANESEDGETPTIIAATKENNGYAVFEESYNGVDMIKWFPYPSQRDDAIEFAVKAAATHPTLALRAVGRRGT